MATFVIRRNHPYAGALTLCKVPGGSFVAKEMTVSESVFVSAVMSYLDKLTPADRSRIRRSAPDEAAAQPGSDQRAFKVRKAAAAAS